MDLKPIGEILFDRGVLGVAAVVLGIVVYTLFKMLIIEKDKRLEDAKLREDGLMQPVKQLNENSTTQITLLRTILERIGAVGKAGT